MARPRCPNPIRSATHSRVLHSAPLFLPRGGANGHRARDEHHRGRAASQRADRRGRGRGRSRRRSQRDRGGSTDRVDRRELALAMLRLVSALDERYGAMSPVERIARKVARLWRARDASTSYRSSESALSNRPRRASKRVMGSVVGADSGGRSTKGDLYAGLRHGPCGGGDTAHAVAHAGEPITSHFDDVDAGRAQEFATRASRSERVSLRAGERRAYELPARAPGRAMRREQEAPLADTAAPFVETSSPHSRAISVLLPSR
jgi:hypothetical protein